MASRLFRPFGAGDSPLYPAGPAATLVLSLGRIWASGQTAVVRCPGRGTALLTGGDAQDTQALALLDEVLAGRPTSIDLLGHQPAVPSVPGFGARVYSALLRFGFAGDEPLQARAVMLREGPARDRLPELPLSASVRELVRHRGSEVPLAMLLERAGVTEEQVTAELRALIALGVLTLRPVAREPTTGWELHRLEQVLRLLSQSSQWRVLEEGPQPPDPTFVAALNRLRVRYLPSPTGEADAEVHQLLQAIQRHLAVLAS